MMETRISPAIAVRLCGYYTRHLAYALIAESALEVAIPATKRSEIENQLWTLQDKDGGIWTDYNRDGSLPDRAKKTNEIGPLVLLAYKNG